MSASDLDKTLNYGPMGHDNIPVRAHFGVFKGLICTPVGKFATAGWAQPFTTEASYGTAYQDYDELLERFGVTKGEDDENFDWDLYYKLVTQALNAVDVQKSSLIVSLKEQTVDGADAVLRFPSWSRNELQDRIYSLPIDNEDPPVTGLNVKTQEPIAGAAIFEFIDSTSKISAVLSYHSVVYGTYNQNASRPFIPTSRGTYFTQGLSVFWTAAQYIISGNGGTKSYSYNSDIDFYPDSNGAVSFTTPYPSHEFNNARLSFPSSFNAYNLGKPIFRESASGHIPQDHDDPDILRRTSFGIKEIKISEELSRYWIIYAHPRIFSFIISVYSPIKDDPDNPRVITHCEWVPLGSGVFIWKEKIYAMECLVSGEKITLVYPRNKQEIGEITYVDYLPKSSSGPIEYNPDTVVPVNSLKNSSIWAFSNDCSKMSAFRTYYERITYKETKCQRTHSYHDYEEHQRILELTIGESGGVPTITNESTRHSFYYAYKYVGGEIVEGGSRTGSSGEPPVPPISVATHGKGLYQRLLLAATGKYNSEGKFELIATQFNIFSALLGNLDEGLANFHNTFILDESEILCSGQRKTEVTLTGVGGKNALITANLSVLKAFDFETKTFIIGEHSWSIMYYAWPKGLIESKSTYTIKDILHKDNKKITLWSESTNDVDEYPKSVYFIRDLPSYYVTPSELIEFPPVLVTTFIEPFATKLKGASAESDYTILNYAWVTPLNLENGFYTYPEDLLERVSPDGTDLWSVGSIRRLT